MKTNEVFRLYAKSKGVKLGEIAQRLNIHPSNFSAKFMRNEMSDEVRAYMILLVNDIAKEREVR